VERLPIPVKPNTFRSNSPSNEDLESHKDTNKSTSEIDGTDSSDGEYLAIHPFRKQYREKKKQAPVEASQYKKGKRSVSQMMMAMRSTSLGMEIS
jgi:hypothetical protein